MRWVPSVEYDVTTLEFSLPQKWWEPEEGAGMGDEDASAAGVPVSYVVRYDQLVNVTFRFKDAERVAVMTFIEWAMKNKAEPLTVRLDKDVAATEYTMYLHSPKTGEMVRPRRVSNAPWTWEVDLTFRTTDSSRVHHDIVLLEDAAVVMPYVAGVGNAASGTAAVGPIWPTHQKYDIGIMVVQSANQTIATPNGWEEIAGSPQSTGTAGAVDAVRLAMFWRRASSSNEAAPFVADPGDHVLARIIVVRGADRSSSPFDVVSGGVDAVADTPVVIPGATTTVDKSLIVQAVTWATDSAAAQLSGIANADLSDLTELADSGMTGGSGGGFAILSGGKAVAGLFGNTTGVLAAASKQAMLSVAIKPHVP